MKYKDSISIKQLMVSKIENIPDGLNGIGEYVVVVTPQDRMLSPAQQMDVHRFLDILKDKIKNSLPSELYTKVRVLHLDRFCS